MYVKGLAVSEDKPCLTVSGAIKSSRFVDFLQGRADETRGNDRIAGVKHDSAEGGKSPRAADWRRSEEPLEA